MKHPYKLDGQRTPRGGFHGYLLEDGDQVAKVDRPSTEPAGVSGSYRIKWYSERARSRFDDFCDSISMSECFEALGDRKWSPST